MQENRLAKAEAQLSGRQRVLAWMHRRQQLGGLVAMVTHDVETNLASSPPIVIEDLDGAFIFHCMNDCNTRVLALDEAHMEKGLLYLCVNRFLATTETPSEDWEIGAFRRALKVFVLQWKLFGRALEILSGEHFSGMTILYSDTAALLEEDLQDAQRLCDLFNAEIAPAFGVAPITHEEIEEYLQAEASRESDRIRALARAKAELDFGNYSRPAPI